MRDISIIDYKYKSRCDINRCSEKADVSIGVPGESLAFNINYCEEHLKQVILEGAERLKDNVFFRRQLIEVIGPLEESPLLSGLKDQLETKNATIEFFNEKVSDMEAVWRGKKGAEHEELHGKGT